MWKKIAVLFVLLIGSVVLLPNSTALAAPEMKVSVSAGFDGKAKYGRGGPLIITIENSGSAFSGDLVIDLPYSYSIGAGEAIPLDIGAGESKTVSLIVPRMNDYGGMYGNSPKSIYLYEGGWEKGKEIEHKGTQYITTSLYHDDSKFVVQFTDNVDRLAALKTMKMTNISNIQLIDAAKIKANVFPEEADGWGAADFIIIDEYPLADLSAKQQEALIGWVRAGGIMVIGGSDNSSAEAGLLAEYLPMQLKNSTEMDASLLNQWIGTDGFQGTIASYLTELNSNAQPLVGDQNHTLIASKWLGQGLVIQTAFSVGDEPLAKMEGMTALWSKVFDTGQRMMQANPAVQYFDDPVEAASYQLGYPNELFPAFKVSAPFIFGIIIFYIILIIPVLYFILKRKDKREYAWWIIPAIAILTSIAIFAYGAKDRIGRAQIQHTAVMNVEQDGSLTGYYAESLLTNKAGDFSFSAPTGTSLVASTQENYLFGSSSTSIHKRQMLEKDALGSTLRLRKVGYWDVASVFGKTSMEKTGNFTIKLGVDDKQLTGSITNDFPFALTDVAIWSGTNLIPVGDLGPGETAQVNETLKTSTLLPRKSMFNPYMNPTPSDTDDLIQMRKDSLLSFSSDQMNKVSKPVVIGYTDIQVIPVELENEKPAISSLTMVTQPADVDVTFTNTFTVVPEMMEMSLLSVDNNYEAYLGYPGDQYYFDEAAYTQTWTLPEELLDKNLKWTSIELSKMQKQMYDTSILNVRTGEFEQVDSNKLTITERVEDYISPKDEIVLRMDLLNTQQGNQGRAPMLKLNGEVAK